ncbi:MAG: hypothetical protein J6S69_06860, partial [Proteobacteria bacterium]|nr:hypothetical protein [Pseudomonadota bacterium]
MTETADKLKDTQACGDIAKVFEPSETVSIMSPAMEAASEVESVPVSLQHLDSEIHVIFGESEMKAAEDVQDCAIATDEISSLTDVSFASESGASASGAVESGASESGASESGAA